MNTLWWDREEAVELCRAFVLCTIMQSLSPSKPSTRNLVSSGAQAGHQITVYCSQHFKFNGSTKMHPDLPSHSSPRAHTQASTIGKCCSASLKLIRTSRVWKKNCSTSLSSTAEIHCALSSVYGLLLFGRGQLKAAPSISRSSSQRDWELSYGCPCPAPPFCSPTSQPGTCSCITLLYMSEAPLGNSLVCPSGSL